MTVKDIVILVSATYPESTRGFWTSQNDGTFCHSGKHSASRIDSGVSASQRIPKM